MNFGDRLHWEKFFSAMVNYKDGRIYLKAFAAYFFAFFVFIVGNLGSRIIGFTFIKKVFKNLDWIKVFIVSAIVIGFAIPLFFIQKGTAWNTIQFSYYSVYFFAILAGYSTYFLLANIKKRYLRYFAVVLIVVFTVPSTIVTLGHYLPTLPHSIVSNNEIEALTFLRNQKQGVVLSLQPYADSSMNSLKKSYPIPIYLYESTAYISALSAKPSFFDDEVNLNILGIDLTERKTKIENFLRDTNSTLGRSFLRDEGISYIYLVKRNGVGLDEETLGIENIYDNDQVIIYRVI